MEKKDLFEYLTTIQSALFDLSDQVWDTPELCFTEEKSQQKYCEVLRRFGFCVETGLAGLETSFRGTFGHGKPVIGFLAEFDALSGLSQKAGCNKRDPVEEGGHGHGCGHNLLGVGALGGAIAMKKYLEDTGKSGTVVLYGCPGEEGGSGKAFMAREGCFQELDCAITWHPSSTNWISNESTLANVQVNYHFTGVSSHAAIAPHMGRSALDAVEMMNVGVQFLREHVTQDARIHYAITNTGGISPNVVQPTADVLYLIRAPHNSQVTDIYQRINKIAQGAALMTETKVDIQFIKGCSNAILNDTLNQVCYRNMQEAPMPVLNEAEQTFAKEMREANPKELDFSVMALRQLQNRSLNGKERESYIGKCKQPYCDFIIPYQFTDGTAPVSSDVGDVSWIVPTVNFGCATWPMGTAAHSWQAVSVGKSGIAHKNMLFASQIMAGMAVDLCNNPQLIEQAKSELNKVKNGEPYLCPIPKGIEHKRLK